MSTYEILSLIVNFFIAVGTLGAIASALYLANKNSKEMKKENCTVEAEYAVTSQQYGYRTGQPQGDMQNSAIQVCVYNHGFRDFYIQSLAICDGKKPFAFQGDIFSTRDVKVPSGYRFIIHIEFKNLIKNTDFLKFYKHNCMGKDTKICVETIFKNRFSSVVSSGNFRLIDEYAKNFVR